MSDHTWLRNPETGGVWSCPNGLVEHYKERGWEDSDPPGEQVVGVLKDAAPEPEFDPAEHTVAEVEDHLEQNPDDVHRVLQAEHAGKNRVTITGTDVDADE